MRKTISLKFNYGDGVALKTEPDLKRIITGIILRPGGKMYEAAIGMDTSWHQEVEIQKFQEPRKVGGFNNKK